MGLHNALFGVNPLANIYLGLLELPLREIPRFRDAYFDGEHIVIFTRTGGGNREYYDEPNENNKEGPWNSTLRAHPLFLSEQDDDFDSTFAYFLFKLPNEEMLAKLKEAIEPDTPPMEKFHKLMADIEARKDTPQTRKAAAVGKKIFEKINEISEGKKP